MATHFKPLLDLFNEHVAVSSEAVDGQNSLVCSREQKKRNYEHIGTLRDRRRGVHTNERPLGHNESGC